MLALTWYNEQDIALIWVVVIPVILLLYWRLERRSRPPYPPGPKGLPIVGNLFDFPSTEEWRTYDRWSKELGSDIVYATAGGSSVVILNSIEAVDDLLEKRSSLYSSRPRLPMTLEIMKCYWNFSLIPYGRSWRERRRLFAQYFPLSGVDAYQPTQIRFVHGMLAGLLDMDKPDNFSEVIRNAVSGTALSLAYGLPIKRTNDPYVRLAQEMIKRLSQSATPGLFMVNLFPILKYIPEFMPGGGFKRKAREYMQVTERFLHEPFNALIQAMDDGTASTSLASSALEDLAACRDGIPEAEYLQRKNIIMDVAATTFSGASDTTLAVVMSFIAAMLLSPETQRKAQEELDRVLHGRLPNHSDEGSLPYISAIVKEVFRWGVVSPIAFPRIAAEDDTYKGYFIPKGSTMIPNSWSFLRDEDRYGPETSTFRPERLMKDGKLNPDVLDPAHIIFGYGRRSCAGSHVAQSLLFLIVSSILTTFEISEEVDKYGSPIPPQIEWEYGVVTQPKPFKCTIKPRSQRAIELIRSLQSEEIT